MWRFVIILCSAPFLIGLVISQLLGMSVVLRSGEVSKTVSQIIHQLLQTSGREDTMVSYVKSPLWSHKPDGVLRLNAKHQHSKQVSHVAQSLIALGFLILSEKHSDTVSWRLKMLRLGHILPAFMLMIAMFTFILAKLPLILALSAVLASLSFCTVMLWLSLPIEKEASLLMVSYIEKLRILPRLSEEEALVSTLRATPWTSLIPGAVTRWIL